MNVMKDVLNVVNDSSYRTKLLDALYDIRTSLAIKRIINKTIPVSKFKEMLVNVKSNYDDRVKEAIDLVFEEFLPVEKEKQSIINTESNDKSNDYSDNGLGKNGSSLVMAKKGFKSDKTNPNDV